MSLPDWQAGLAVCETLFAEPYLSTDSRHQGLILHSAEYPDGHFLGWTPGQVAPLAPKGLAWRLAPGADFVVQLHMRPTGKPERIQPAIGLYFTSDAPASVPAMLRLGRQNIDIPPGQAEYRSTDAFTLPVDAQVRFAGARRGAFGAHMAVELVNDGPVTLLLEA